MAACVAAPSQVAAVLVVSDPAMRAALTQELPGICLLAKLDADKVGYYLRVLLPCKKTAWAWVDRTRPDL